MNHDNIMMLIIPKAEVCYLYSDDTLRQGLEKMKQYGYTAIPVISETGEYVGVVREGDFLWKIIQTGAVSKPAQKALLVKDILQTEAYAAAKIDESMEDLVAKVMQQNFVPVVDDRGCFCGIVTRRVILKHFIKVLSGKKEQ